MDSHFVYGLEVTQKIKSQVDSDQNFVFNAP